ncbi:helix-turn-helix domain-containing protein [Nonomuraea rhizosphaerae]|uniref:helix-turn-helix domain-containing protein n=1 Tax=Nonomuraea rhizosphaerae TaxID=2665663 RepID=UPI001C5EAD4B|nr:helix-turn-helix transcriptional regulator [Nonomuraea rhizosphaerae]
MSPFRAWRLENGLSLEEVADLSGISAAMISRVERGERQMAPLTKVQVARRLGVRVRDLFTVDGQTGVSA